MLTRASKQNLCTLGCIHKRLWRFFPQDIFETLDLLTRVTRHHCDTLGNGGWPSHGEVVVLRLELLKELLSSNRLDNIKVMVDWA